MGGATSSFEINGIGVVQDSIPSPTLFNLYINDIMESSKIVNFFIYADDTRASKWFTENHSTLNVKKK